MITFWTSCHLKTHHRYAWYLVIIALLLISFVIVSCNGGPTVTSSSPTSEIVGSKPTQTSQPPQSTDSPLIQPNSDPTPIPTLDIRTGIYHHTGGLFNLLVPQTWTINQSQNSSNFNDPQGEAGIQVQVVNTGYPLDKDSFWRLVEARESNALASNDNLIEINQHLEESNGSILIKKQLFDQGVRKSVVTFYQQQGPAIFIVDLWSKKERFEAYQEMFDAVVGSTAFNAEAVSKLPMYSTDIENVYRNDYLSISFPPFWKITQTSGDYSSVNTIYSPDERAIVQVVIYDDGEYLSKTVAGKLVLNLLRDRYAKDIIIDSDTLLPDGRERLTWKSNRANYQGITLFETRDTALMMVTLMWDNEYSGYYQVILDDILNTYKVNDSSGE